LRETSWDIDPESRSFERYLTDEDELERIAGTYACETDGQSLAGPVTQILDLGNAFRVQEIGNM
jgi:hypothetical protein